MQTQAHTHTDTHRHTHSYSPLHTIIIMIIIIIAAIIIDKLPLSDKPQRSLMKLSPKGFLLVISAEGDVISCGRAVVALTSTQREYCGHIKKTTGVLCGGVHRHALEGKVTGTWCCGEHHATVISNGAFNPFQML